MDLPVPYEKADDAMLVAGCSAGDEDAWRSLDERHGPLLLAVVTRVLDERRTGDLTEVPILVTRVHEHLKRNQAGPLRTWTSGSSLRPYLAAIARQVASEHLQNETPIGNLITPLPTPAEVLLDDLVGVEPAQKMTAALGRLSPQVMAVLRLRLRGLTVDDIAAALGSAQQSVLGHLEHTAERVAQVQGGDEEAVRASWRLLLDCASPRDRVGLALRTIDDAEFRKVRSMAEATWRAVRERAFALPQPRATLCLDLLAAASFVDGSLRGANRARSEGHVATCRRCTDLVATLVMDLRCVDVLRIASHLPRAVAVAAALIATTRFVAGQQMASEAARYADPRAKEVLRVAHAGIKLQSRRSDAAPPPEPSQVAPRQGAIPSDEEAPLVALEALAAGDPNQAFRAIDDHVAKEALGARLRLLAAAAGRDLEDAGDQARALLDKGTSDPALRVDAMTVMALPAERALPRETLVERLRAAIPDVLRQVITR